MITDGPLSRDDIITAAEDALRRFGPEKATVVDVARALGVSHGSVYRHFSSKAALRDAVARKWLKATSDPLGAIAAGRVKPPARLRAWIDRLRALKRTKVLDDPEMFATYHALAVDSRAVVVEHVDVLTGQIERILRDGVASGDFAIDDPHASALAILNATQRFHHPMHANEWSQPDNDAAFAGVWSLVERGIRA